MQTPHLDKVIGFYKQKRRLPSYSEIIKLLGLKSKNSAYRLIHKMLGDGLLIKDNAGKLIPTKKLWGNVRVLGTVEAGWPSPAEEELLDTLTIDEYLIGNREATFMLKVKGDSMIDAGVMPGDMVLVERGGEARDGDIVIAEVDHQWTMKYYKLNNGQPYLRPANIKFKDIYPKEQLKVAAVVKAVIRKYS